MIIPVIVIVEILSIGSVVIVGVVGIFFVVRLDLVIVDHFVVLEALWTVGDSVEGLVDGTLVFVRVVVVEPAFVFAVVVVVWRLVLLIVAPVVVGGVADDCAEGACFVRDAQRVVHHYALQ